MIKMQQAVTMSLRLIILTALLISFSACAPSNSGMPDGTAGAGGTTGTGITVSSNPTSISTYGLASITATVRDVSGNLVADGTAVTFSLSDSTMGTLSSGTATTSGGTTTVYFTAANKTGSITITSTSGGLSGSVTISISATATGAVSLSASPSTVSPSNTSTIAARVVDSAGNPVVDGSIVSFTLDNPSLGSISPSSAVTSNGNATGTFTASTDTGTVTITATSGTITGSIAITIGGTTTSTAAASISLTPTPQSITTSGTSSVQATVTTSTGANVADGTSVSFSLSAVSMGTITTQATTSNGIATATFTAANTPGTVTVTATAEGVTDTENITIIAPASGSIEFVSATPQVIGVKGFGQTETSDVKFLLKDINGNPVVDGIGVSFTMNGPSGGNLPADGGEYLGDIDSSPTTATASTVGGYASVILHSGKVAGPVTIIATVTGISPAISSSSAVISIGGGVPSATHFNLAVSQFNIAGFSVSGSEATIEAYMADRFGNYNVLTGTSVSFYTEAGAIERHDTTTSVSGADEAGKAEVVIRTQEPMPSDVTKSSAGDSISTAYFGGGNEPFYTYGGQTYNPRDGWVTILATVQGEEAFNDANGNGLYDAGEAFTDLGEPFYDKNDDGCYNNGATMNCNGVISASTDPFEEYIDVNGNGTYNFPNGVWDGPACPAAGCQTSKMIWDDIKMVYTGIPNFYPLPDVSNCYNCNAFASGSFAVAPASITKGTSGLFTVIVADTNLNTLEGGTTIEASATVGTIAPSDPLVLPDVFSTGPTTFSFYLDIDPTETKTNSLVSVKATWRGADYIATISVPLITAPLTIVSGSTLPPGSVGTAYSVTLSATGGTSPYTWAKTAGTLPTGLTLASSTGAISGTPTVAGTYNFDITVYDSVGVATSKAFSITVS